MVLEQLDLFGNPVYITSSGKVLSAPPTPEMELAEVGDETNAVVTKKGLSSERSKNKKAVHTMEKNLENESRVMTKETNNDVQLQEMPLDNQVVYSDNQIRVRIKLKPAPTVVSDSMPEEPIKIEHSEIEEQKQITELPPAIEAIQQDAQPKAVVVSPFDTIASTLTVPKAPLLTNPFSSIYETAELISSDITSNPMDSIPSLETELQNNPIVAEELATEMEATAIEDSVIVEATAVPETAITPTNTPENIIAETPARSLVEVKDVEIASEVSPSEKEIVATIGHQIAADEETLVPEMELAPLPIVENNVEEVTVSNLDAQEKATDLETILTDEKIVGEIVTPNAIETTVAHELLTESAPVEENLPVESEELVEAHEPALDLQSISLAHTIVSEIGNPEVVKELIEEAFPKEEQIVGVAAIAAPDIDLSATITALSDIELPTTTETESKTEPSEIKSDLETNGTEPLMVENTIEADSFSQEVALTNWQNEENNQATEALNYPEIIEATPLSIHAEQPNTKENVVMESSSPSNLTAEILSSSIHVALPTISNNLNTRNEQPISDSEHIVQAFIPDIAPDAVMADKFPINEHELAAQTIPKRGRRSYKAVEISSDLVNIPDDETLQKKLYYGIGEVAEWFGVNTSQIRFWENEFDVLQPRKTKKGDRLFRVEDIKNLQLIHHLLRNRKFSLEGAKDYLKANKQHADLHFELTQSLTKFRSFLLELKASLGV